MHFNSSTILRCVVVGALLSACTAPKPGTQSRYGEGGAPITDVPTNTNDIPDTFVPTTDVISVDASCIDPTGFGGRGCYRCPPTTREQLLNACTTARCEAFDNSRLMLNDGALPMLPSPDAAADVPMVDVPNFDVPTDAQVMDVPVIRDAGPGLPLCSTVSPHPIIYAAGSTAATLFLGRVAQALANSAPNFTIVYKSLGSCAGVNAMVSAASNPLTGTAIYWNPDMSVDPTSAAGQISCQIDPGMPLYADVGFSDVFAASCVNLPGGLDPSLRDFFGPNQVMNFVVPQNSASRVISGEAAFLVYGFGASGAASTTVAPWTDPLRIHQRNSLSGTQAMIAETIGVPRDRWRGVANAGSSNVRDSLIAAGSAGQAVADRAIGILSSDFADGLRAQIRILAYQDFRQNCGFWPDSDAMSNDKRNVRDGHFPIWGPLHIFARVNGAGVPLRPGVQRMVNLINGVENVVGLDIIDTYARRGLIPQCAMRVTRASDGGEIRPMVSANSCGCYFEERATGLNPPPNCTPCDRPNDCPATAPNCNRFAGQARGYCEP